MKNYFLLLILATAFSGMMTSDTYASSEAQNDSDSPAAKLVAARAAEKGLPQSQLVAPVAEAARRGIPPDLVAAKILEGLSKNVPAPRITAVARGLSDRLVAAQELLNQAQQRKLAFQKDQRSVLLDLSTVFATSVDKSAVESLLNEACDSSQGTVASWVSAARTLGELARHGITPSQTMKMGKAIARHGPKPPGEVLALFQAWKQEGGKDAGAFFQEVTTRIEKGHRLHGLVDYFGNSPDQLIKEHGRSNKNLSGSQSFEEKQKLNRRLDMEERIKPSFFPKNNKNKSNDGTANRKKTKHLE